VCPLDWGIGHAARCAPVIMELTTLGSSVIIAADGRSYDFLKSQFPNATIIRFPGVKVIYPEKRSMALLMLLQSPAILYRIWKEHMQLKKIINEYQVDLVISDNRFGLWSKKVKTVYITHQVMIKAPPGLRWMEPLLYRIHRWFINKFDSCWIPDVPGEPNLSGDLSHRYPLPSNAKYIGILSRFNHLYSSYPVQTPGMRNKLLVMISGPEPQRTIFENLILKELALNPVNPAVILQGLPGEKHHSTPYPGVTVFPHLPDEEIGELIKDSDIIICRSGYSTLMDLVRLGKTAVLVPTPGQTEQEYLAQHLSKSGLFASIDQESFSPEAAIEAGKKLSSKTDIFEFNNINTFGQKFKHYIDLT